MRRRRLAAAALATLVALILAACGGSSNSGSGEPVQPTGAPAEGQATDEPASGEPASEELVGDGTDSAPEGFEATVQAARDQALAAIVTANMEGGDAAFNLSTEQALMGPIAESIATGAVIVSDYADTLESLEAPPELAADLTRHVEELRATITRMEAAVAAASAGDDARLSELQDQIARELAKLAAELEPAYGEIAFLSPFGSDLDFASFSELNETELAYLEGVRAAQNEFGTRVANFGRAISRTYVSEQDLLAALYEAGAGTAFAAVQTAALELDPPERFAEDHTRWLLLLEEQVRLDTLIGEAARDGDALGFAVNNVRLGLLAFPEALQLDPAFATAAVPGSPLGSSLELAEVAPELSEEYPRDLFNALLLYQLADPLSAVFATFDIPGLGDAAPAAIVETGDELLAAIEASRDEIAALTALDELVADHERILRYFDETIAGMEEVVATAETGDGPATRQALEANSGPDSTYCTTAAELSEEIKLAAGVHFHPDAPFCTN